MGISASATLAYGIDLADSKPWNLYDDNYEPYHPELEDDEEVEELADYLALKAGLRSPWDDVPRDVYNGPYDEFKRWKAEHPEWEEAYEAYNAARKKLEDECPVRMEYHGMSAYDYSAYGLVINDDRCIREEFGSNDISKAGLPTEPTPEMIQRAVEFCKEHNFGDFSEATWLLLTNVG